MARAEYYVVRYDGDWMIGFRGKHYGPYITQKEAIQYAVYAANQAQGGALVLVHEADGKFRTEWTCGLDPYTPKG